eukprot:10287045-Ditylum_brightwellii.AAC.1
MTNDEAHLPSLNNLLSKLRSHCVQQPSLPCSLLQANNKVTHRHTVTTPAPAPAPTPIPQPASPHTDPNCRRSGGGQFAPGQDRGNR